MGEGEERGRGREGGRRWEEGRRGRAEKMMSIEDDSILYIVTLKNPPKTITTNKQARQLKTLPNIQTSLAYLR